MIDILEQYCLTRAICLFHGTGLTNIPYVKTWQYVNPLHTEGSMHAINEMEL